MRMRAIAYHESVAVERLQRYFGKQGASLAGTAATKCENCNLNFAILLPSRDHPDNPRYILQSTRAVSEDCINGMHQDEHVLNAS
jgi:hypothetical protein